MKHIPALAVVCFTIQLLVAGHAPYVGGHTVFLFQNLLRLEHFIHNRAAAEQLRVQLSILLFGGLEAVHAFQNALANACSIRHGRHRQWFVRDRQIIKDGLLIHVHALDAVLDNDRDFVSKGGIIGHQIRH